MQEQPVLLEEDGFEDEILVEEEPTVVNAMWGGIGGNIENQTDLQNALDAKQDSLTEAQLNAVNSGITSEKVTTYDGYADQIASKADQSALNAEATTRSEADTALGTRIDNEALARQNADNGLQTQIDAITSQSDVVDVVANYAALQAYDTSSLSDNDVIKVLDDETHEDALTYYRWSTATQTWSYIGQEAPYYSKGQMDVMLQGKQDTLTAGANIQIQNGTISATDTKYTAGNGLNLNGTEFSADTDVLATKEDLEDYYTKTEADNLLAPKLEAEVAAELPTTGEEGKLYLTPKAHTTQTATGNPITATVAEEAGAIESFQLDGDTFQQTYEGKNLFDVSASLEYKWLRAEDGLVVDSSDPNIVAPLLHVVVGTTYVISGIGDLQFNLFTYSDDSFSNPVRAINNSRTRRTFTATTEWLRFSIGGGDAVAIKNDIQFEVGSTATTYEPYVGGIPSPNPEYPQPIHTVTGEQTVEIQGKNLFDATATPWFSGRAYDANGEMAYWSGYAAILGYQPVEPNSTYTFSNSAGKPIYYGLVFYDADKNKISNVTSATPTFTTPANCHYVRFAIQNSSAPTWTQLELGSTATDYAPYFKQTLPLDLGTIELHSLDGNYLDRIFKDGNDWKIHKATASDRMSSADNWVIPNPSSYPNLFQAVVNRLDLAPEYVLNSSALEALCEELTYMDSGAVRTAQGFAVYNNEGSKLVRINHAGFTTVAQLKDWLSNNNVEILFALAIPTDTIITDTTLIAQLEAIRTALLQNGTNTITNNATGSNLAGDMEIGYYGYNPTNRYDKWLWLDINNDYEQIGS